MANADANNVSTGKPKIGGAIYRAPLGTKLPTNAREALDPAFENLGYVSEDGLTNSQTINSDNTKAWGGDIVHVSQVDKDDKFKYKLIEALNKSVLEAVYNKDNVTVDPATGDITIKVNAEESEPASWIIEMILKGKRKKRIVIPSGKISEIGDIVYKDNEVTGYDLAITAVPDETGNKHYEYITGGKVDSSVPGTP